MGRIASCGAMNAQIRAVTFDVGGTLIKPWPSVGDVYAEVARDFGIHVGASELDRMFASIWSARQDFDYSRGAWRQLVNRTFAELISRPPEEGCFDAIYQRFARASAWRVFRDVRPALAQLKAQGLKAGIISNWDERLRPLLEELGLLRWFDAAISSHEAGHCKPAREIFEQAAERLSSPPGTIVHVGDSEREDVRGARAAGFRALLLRRCLDTAGAISSLGSLSTALEALSRHPAVD
jgi:putative hydrolase of the HAD superfamily